MATLPIDVFNTSVYISVYFSFVVSKVLKECVNTESQPNWFLLLCVCLFFENKCRINCDVDYVLDVGIQRITLQKNTHAQNNESESLNMYRVENGSQCSVQMWRVNEKSKVILRVCAATQLRPHTNFSFYYIDLHYTHLHIYTHIYNVSS